MTIQLQEQGLENFIEEGLPVIAAAHSAISQTPRAIERVTPLPTQYALDHFSSELNEQATIGFQNASPQELPGFTRLLSLGVELHHDIANHFKEKDLRETQQSTQELRR